MRNVGKGANRIALALGVIFFLLYASTSAPSIVELYDDSLEFQLVGPTFGIAHPTGYPLYTLLGGLWSRVLFPAGNWAWRMNLFSALAAAATVALLFLLTQRLTRYPTLPAIKERREDSPSTSSLLTLWPGLLAATAFGLSPIWWSQATIAEVYALHNLLVVTLLLLALSQSSISTPPITLLAFIFGLALTHHRTIVLLVPGLLLLLWGRRALWQLGWHWLRLLGALLAPLLLYLYIPIRAATGVRDLNGSYVNTWDGFWQHVLALGYTGFFTENELTRWLTTADWVRLWWTQYGAVGMGLGVMGLLWILWRGQQRQNWLALLVILTTNAGFAIAYRVGDPEVFMLPALLLFALLIGAGGVAMVSMVACVGVRYTVPLRRQFAHILWSLLLLLIIIGVGGRGAPIDRSQDWTIHDYAVAMAKVDFPPESQVIGLEGQITALRYMQEAEGFGMNALGIVANEPDARVAAIDRAVAAGYPTYVTQEVVGIAERYSFSGEGPFVRVWPRGMAMTQAPENPLAHEFVNGQLILTGYDQTWLDEAGGPTLRLALYWQPQHQLDRSYKLSLRLLDETGTIVQWPNGAAVTADRFPLRQVAPTTAWLPGEIVRDVHYLPLPQRTMAAHTLQIILYDATTIAEAGSIHLPVKR